MIVDLTAGKHIKVASVKMTSALDQAIKGVQDSIFKTIQEQASETKQTTITDQLVDGFMSGSTITKIVVVIVLGGGLITIIVLVLKMLGGKKVDDEQTLDYSQYYQYY